MCVTAPAILQGAMCESSPYFKYSMISCFWFILMAVSCKYFLVPLNKNNLKLFTSLVNCIVNAFLKSKHEFSKY